MTFGLLFMLPSAAPDANAADDRQFVYVSPTGSPGYWRIANGDDPNCGAERVCRREAAGTLAAVLADHQIVPPDRSATVEIRLLTESEDDVTADYPTQGKTLWIKSKGAADKRLRIVGQASGRFDGSETVLTRIVGKSLKRTVCDPLPVARRGDCEAGRIAEGVLPAVLAGDFMSSILDLLAAEKRSVITLPFLAAGSQATRLNCFAIENSDWIELDGVAFRDCWLPAIYLRDSKNISIRRARIEGSSYAIIAEATNSQPEQAGHITIRDSHWVQSTAHYLPAPAAPCDPRSDLDCPVDIWDEIPWGVTHDRFWEPLNGAFFGSRDVAGDVTISDSLIEDAYNGIRMGLSKDCRIDRQCRTATNRRVDISRNTFVRIRDNPIEPERRADLWWIQDNNFVESHSWISTDGVQGGRIYVVGNTGRFIDGFPGDSCESAGWERSPLFIFHPQRMKEGYCIPGEAGPCKGEDPDGFNPSCQNLAEERQGLGRAARGKVLKTMFETLMPGVDPLAWKAEMRKAGYLAEIYFIHNSWYLLKPYIGQGYPSPISHWNNIVAFANCGDTGASECRAVPSDEAGCEYFHDHWSTAPSGDGKALFATCMSFSGRIGKFEHRFDHDASNFAWPSILTANGQAASSVTVDESSGRRLFRDAAAGDFRPADPQLVGRACKVEWVPETPGELRCEHPAEQAAIGALQPDGSRFSLGRPW